MTNPHVPPIEKVLQRKKDVKNLKNEVYEKIFYMGVEKTAEFFLIKPEEVVKLIIPIVRKNKNFDEFYMLTDKQNLYLICEKMEELQTLSIEKIFECCESFAKKWEVYVAKEILRQKLNRESFE